MKNRLQILLGFLVWFAFWVCSWYVTARAYYAFFDKRETVRFDHPETTKYYIEDFGVVPGKVTKEQQIVNWQNLRKAVREIGESGGTLLFEKDSYYLKVDTSLQLPTNPNFKIFMQNCVIDCTFNINCGPFISATK